MASVRRQLGGARLPRRSCNEPMLVTLARDSTFCLKTAASKAISWGFPRGVQDLLEVAQNPECLLWALLSSM